MATMSTTSTEDIFSSDVFARTYTNLVRETRCLDLEVQRNVRYATVAHHTAASWWNKREATPEDTVATMATAIVNCFTKVPAERKVLSRLVQDNLPLASMSTRDYVVIVDALRNWALIIRNLTSTCDSVSKAVRCSNGRVLPPKCTVLDVICASARIAFGDLFPTKELAVVVDGAVRASGLVCNNVAHRSPDDTLHSLHAVMPLLVDHVGDGNAYFTCHRVAHPEESSLKSSIQDSFDLPTLRNVRWKDSVHKVTALRRVGVSAAFTMGSIGTTAEDTMTSLRAFEHTPKRRALVDGMRSGIDSNAYIREHCEFDDDHSDSDDDGVVSAVARASERFELLGAEKVVKEKPAITPPYLSPRKRSSVTDADYLGYVAKFVDENTKPPELSPPCVDTESYEMRKALERYMRARSDKADADDDGSDDDDTPAEAPPTVSNQKGDDDGEEAEDQAMSFEARKALEHYMAVRFGMTECEPT